MSPDVADKLAGPCPSPTQLQSLLEGSLSEAEACDVARHLQDCPACDQAAAGLLANSAVTRWRSLWPELEAASQAAGPLDGEDSTSITLDTPVPAAGGEPAADRSPTPIDPAQLLAGLSEFRNVREIGRGSFGIVLQAESLLHPRVAIKVLRPDRAEDPKEVLRFSREARATASVTHDHVVRIYHVGTAPISQLPYIVMEYVAGESLRERLHEEGPWSPRKAAETARQVALGLEAAHQAGLVHRDVKPGNILLEQGSGRAKITDFGLAAISEGPRTQQSLSETIVGTVQYMSPEQIRSPESVDARSDVYSLGVVLYELLTGERPFRGTGHALLLQVVHDEPPPPRRLNPAIPRDLETIVLRCLGKLPSQRYAAAGEAAADLERFLNREPVKARPIGKVQRTVRWCRRRPWQAAALGLGALAVGLILAGATASVQSARREAELRAQAERIGRHNEVKSAQGRHQLVQMRIRLGEYRNDAEGGLEIPERLASWETRFIKSQLLTPLELIAALPTGRFGVLDAALSSDTGRMALVDSSGLLQVWDLDSGRLIRQWSPDRWSQEKRRWLHHFEAPRPDEDFRKWGRCYTAIRWLDGGSRVAVASLDGTAVLLDTAEKVPEIAIALEEPLFAVAVSADHRQILFGGAQGALFLLADGRILTKQVRAAASVTAIEPLDAGEGWLVGRADGAVEWLTGVELRSRKLADLPGPVWALDIARTKSPRRFAVAAQSPRIQLIECEGVQAERIRVILLPPPKTERSIAAFHRVRFSADGRHVYAVDDGGSLACWDAAQGTTAWTLERWTRNDQRERLRLELGQRGVKELPLPFQRIGGAIHERPEQKQLITADDDATIRIQRLPGPDRGLNRLTSRLGPRPRIALGAGASNRLWALDENGRLSIVDCASDRVLDSRQAHAGGACDLAVVPGSDRLLTVGGDRTVRLWRCSGGKIQEIGKPYLQHDQPLIGVAVSPDGRWIAAVDESARLVVWGFATGARRCLLDLSPPPSQDTPALARRPLTGRVAFNRDGTKLCAFGSGQAAPVFETAGFRPLPDQVWVAGNGGTALIWSPVAADVVVALDDYPRCVIRDFANSDDLLETRPIREPLSPGIAAAVTPDARRVVVAERSGRILFFESEFLMELVTLQSRLPAVSDLAFDPDGSLMAVAGEDGALEIWQAGRSPAVLPVAAEVDAAWVSTPLVEPTAIEPRVESRMVQMDSRGQIGMLYVEGRPTDYRMDGALYYVHESDGRVERERLEAAEPGLSRRAAAPAAALAYGPGDQPVGVFRLRTAADTGYDGRFCVAYRREPNRWEITTIHPHGNWGFYPLPSLDPSGAVEEILHYSFDGKYLMRSWPGEAAAAEWQSEKLGLQGDGGDLQGKRGPDGRLHLVFGYSRFNADQAPDCYGCWDGRQLQRDPIDPYQKLSLIEPELAPDGTPVVAMSQRLLRFEGRNWVEFARLPEPLALDFAVSAAGDVYFTRWDQRRRAMLLWHGREDRFSVTRLVASYPEGEPNWWTIRLDATGQPVIVTGQIGKPYGWVSVLRPQAR